MYWIYILIIARLSLSWKSFINLILDRGEGGGWFPGKYGSVSLLNLISKFSNICVIYLFRPLATQLVAKNAVGPNNLTFFSSLIPHLPSTYALMTILPFYENKIALSIYLKVKKLRTFWQIVKVNKSVFYPLPPLIQLFCKYTAMFSGCSYKRQDVELGNKWLAMRGYIVGEGEGAFLQINRMKN